jgi:RNA polymerase sigma-70 factor (ECF subfamily)
MTPSDGELIQRIKKKDENAFNELFDRYQTPIFRYLMYLTKNLTEAEDLFQETWLRVTPIIIGQNQILNFKAWVFKIATNLYRDLLRKKRVRRMYYSFQKFVFSTELEPQDNLINCTLVNVQDELNQIDLGLTIKTAVCKLPEKQRKVFILKEVEGFKHSEISRILVLPEGTVKSLLHRAVKFLQKELGEYTEK